MENSNCGRSQRLLYADCLCSYRSVAPNRFNEENKEDVRLVLFTIILMASVQTDYKYTQIYPTKHIIKSHQTAFLLL